MKPVLLFALLLHAQLANARPPRALDLVAATAQQEVAVSAQAFGLGDENLTCTITNRTREELAVRVPPGLHFAASDDDRQDLLTFQAKLLVLRPGASTTIQLWGFCMEQHDHIPTSASPYLLRGLAGRGLKPLADSLQKYPGLAANYGQLFVWNLTDQEPLRDLSVAPALVRGATNILRYLRGATGQLNVPVKVTRDNRPSERTFTKRVFLSYHSPTAQVASVKVYGPDGCERYVVTPRWVLKPGVMHYSFGLNTIVGSRELSAFTVRLLSSTGQVLQEQHVTDETTETETAPAHLPVAFSFKLDQPVKNARLRIRLPDGTLVEEFRQLPYLPAGDHQYKWLFYHLRPAGTPFTVRLETAAGQLLREQALAPAILPTGVPEK